MKQKVINILSDIRPEFDFSDETLSYFDEGMLDSFDMVSLVDSLESEFNVKIDGVDIVPENFSDLNSIVSLLQRLI